VIGVILTGHGKFASGVADGLRLIAGEQEGFAVVEFTPDLSPEELAGKLLSAVESLGGEEVLILCDLAGGTPFNETLKLLPSLGRPTEVLAGVNLPVLIEACVSRDGETVSSLAAQLLEMGRGQLVRFVPPDLSDGEYDE
jgi:mannose/fructose/sorbose-specific phosphotransferase system IIA component